MDGNGRETFVIYLVLAGGGCGGDAVRLVSAVITHTNIEEGGRKIICTKKINITLIHSLLFPQTTIIICLVSIYANLSQHIDYLKFL